MEEVVEAIISDDGGVRKANILVRKEDGVLKTYLRPISELVLIVHSQNSTDACKE